MLRGEPKGQASRVPTGRPISPLSSLSEDQDPGRPRARSRGAPDPGGPQSLAGPPALLDSAGRSGLLLEEFRRAGVEIVFLQHPISDDPNDKLLFLLQIQGAIAEYERAVLGERFRRGKLQKARD